jgi:hypothetical protein
VTVTYIFSSFLSNALNFQCDLSVILGGQLYVILVFGPCGTSSSGLNKDWMNLVVAVWNCHHSDQRPWPR